MSATVLTEAGARVGGAPISWGVCEAPDWGYQMPPLRVLAEMRELGLTATELGPTGYLGTDPDAVRSLLATAGLTLIGGFLPVVMHTDANFVDAGQAMSTLAAAGADIVVLAAQLADGGYDNNAQLQDGQWQLLLKNLQVLQEMAAEYGLRCALHPHVGTAIESRESVLRVIENSDIPICLDTGHLFIGGMDPSELIDQAASRIQHVHLKDVRASVAAAASSGDSSYIEAVRAGLYTPLGDGDLDIAAIVDKLRAAGYDGWYVLEQDIALLDEPAPDGGPIGDVRRSLEFLTDVFVASSAS